jgi:uncharacterized repeat protein (TIGR01451 family)
LEWRQVNGELTLVQTGPPTVGQVSASGQISVTGILADAKNPIGVGGITRDPSGNDWFVAVDSTTSYLDRISSSGAVNLGGIPNFHLRFPYGYPATNVVAAPDGTIWIAGDSSGFGGVEHYNPLTDQFTFLATNSNQDPNAAIPTGKVFNYLSHDLVVTPDGGLYGLFSGRPQDNAGYTGDYGARINSDGSLGAMVVFDGGLATSVASLGNGALLVSFGDEGPEVYTWDVTDPDGTFLTPVDLTANSAGCCIVSPGDGYAYGRGFAAYRIGDIEGAGFFSAVPPAATFGSSGDAWSAQGLGSDGNDWFGEYSTDPSTGNGTSAIGRLNIERVNVSVANNATDKVRPGETVHFVVSGNEGPDGATSLTASATIPDGLTLVPGSVTGDASPSNAQGNSINLTVTDRNTFHFEFDATVNSEDSLPLGATKLTVGASATASFADGRVVSGSGASDVNLAQANEIRITLTPNTYGPVAPGQSIDFTATADVATTADALTISVNAPAGTVLFGPFPTNPTVGTTTYSPVPSVSETANNPTSVTITFALLVQSADQLGARTSIDCVANASASFPDGTQDTRKKDVQLKVNAPLQINVSAAPGSVHPGDTLTYTLNVSSTSYAPSFAVKDQLAPGVTVITSSIQDGGTVSTGQGGTLINWTLPGGTNAATTFAVRVANTQDLPLDAPILTDTAFVTAVINGQNLQTSNSAKTQLILPVQIIGKVADPYLDYPNVNVMLPKALARATVQLLRSWPCLRRALASSRWSRT